MRHGFNDEITMIERPTGPGEATEEWSLFAVAFEAVFIGMCEPIDPTHTLCRLHRLLTVVRNMTDRCYEPKRSCMRFTDQRW